LVAVSDLRTRKKRRAFDKYIDADYAVQQEMTRAGSVNLLAKPVGGFEDAANFVMARRAVMEYFGMGYGTTFTNPLVKAAVGQLDQRRVGNNVLYVPNK
jgi:hypothetical protein